MSLITRTYTFSDGTTAYGSQVESELANLVNAINNLDSASTTWDIVKAVNGSSTPLIADNSSGTNSVFEARVNGVAKFVVGSTGAFAASNGGTVSGAALAMSSLKITGLANGTAASDAAAFGQIKYLQAVQATDGTLDAFTAASFGNTHVIATITPTSASNRVKVTVTTHIELASNATAYLTLKRGSTDIGFSTTGLTYVGNASSTATGLWPVSLSFIDSPAASTATTYTLAIKADGSRTVRINVATSSTIIAEEIV